MGCADAVRRLWVYLDGDLADVDRAQLEAHLVWCRRCCGEVEFARHLQQMLATATSPDLPPPVEQRLESFLDRLEMTDHG